MEFQDAYMYFNDIHVCGCINIYIILTALLLYLVTMLYGNFLTQQIIRDINNFEINSHFNFSVHLKLWGFSHFGIRHLKFKGLKNLHIILYGLHCSLILSGTIYIQVYVYGIEMCEREFLASYMSDMETKSNHIIHLFFLIQNKHICQQNVINCKSTPFWFSHYLS